MIKHNPECIHEKTSSPFLQLWNKQERRRARRRFQKLLRRHDGAVCPRRELLQNSSEGQKPMTPPSENSEERWAQLVATQYSFISRYLRERLKEKMREGTEPSETDTSDEEPVHSTSGGRTHSRKKQDRKDAQVHSRLPAVKRKEDIKEQADWHHTRKKELLRNDIKEILREELAVEHAKMRKLFRKYVEEIRELLMNELSQICMEQVALLKEQAKEKQQEHRNLQYLWVKELFRRDLKEMVSEQIQNSKIIICHKEPLPGPPKGTTDFQVGTLTGKDCA
ncbi:hypothetical protein LEMLEM_LOCUS15586 [Lemmus lemmus]